MSDFANWPEADDLLDRALALPESDRLAFIRGSAGHDPDLRAALESVILEAGRDDGFLDPAGALSGSLGREVQELLEADAPAASTLPDGTLIEHYEILNLIGRGGMGEVYRARDTRLNREVALKVLPDRFSRDLERIGRFRREARALAALNHPGVGAIFGVAASGEIEALVLELVEGPTLADRLEGGAVPLDEALTIGRRLAEAIAAAHAGGILHRDLKPSNIKLTPEGGIKVLDFGLAKMLAPDGEAPQASGANLHETAQGLVMGTASYMSPEQAQGRAVNERADIWAFGCVLFEMLTGTRAFPGTSGAEVIARVIEREPAFGLLPAATPEAVRRLLRRTLEKNPSRRLAHIGDALLEFDDATAPSLEEERPRASRWVMAAWAAAGITAGAAAALFIVSRASLEPPAVARFIVPLPAGDAPVTGFQPMTALSPDGRVLVYRARRNGVVQLFRRDMHQLEPQPIPGTEQATSPFFSPDGRWLGFDADGILKRVSLAGGAPVVIAPAPGGVTATWMTADSIVFATNTSRVLQRVPASGGQPEALTALDHARGDTLHLLPQALPDGRSLLFTIVSGSTRRVALRRPSGEIRIVAEGTHGRYLTPGCLVFFREGTLWGAPFDLARSEVAGTAVPLVEGIEHTDNTVLHFDVAKGALAYLPAGEGEGGLQRLVWIDREGRETEVNLEPGPYLCASLSPDGKRVALAVRERGNTDIWIAEPNRRATSRLTFDPTIETMPAWSPDDRTIAFRSEREGPGIFQRDPQGARPIERLTSTDGPIHSPYGWTPDGKTLLFALFRSFRHQAIASVTPPDATVRVLLDGNFAQLDPQVSPDGRWLAYQSDETGRFEVYVRPYPDVNAGRWQVSTAGGTSPRWNPNRGELHYLDPSGLMSVPVSSSTSFSAGEPRRMFAVKPFGGRLGGDLEVAPDGERFLFILDGPPEAVRPSHLVVVQNWAEELRARLRQ